MDCRAIEATPVIKYQWQLIKLILANKRIYLTYTTENLMSYFSGTWRLYEERR